MYSVLKDIAVLHWNEKRGLDLGHLKGKKGQYQVDIMSDILSSPFDSSILETDL